MWYWTCDKCNHENPCINDTCELCKEKWSVQNAAEMKRVIGTKQTEIAETKKKIAIDKVNQTREKQKRFKVEKRRLQSATFYVQMMRFMKIASIAIVPVAICGILFFCFNLFGLKKELFWLFQGVLIVANGIAFAAILMMFGYSVVNNFTKHSIVTTTTINGYIAECRILGVISAIIAYFCLPGKTAVEMISLYQVLSISSRVVGMIWIVFGILNLLITAVAILCKRKKARIELLDGTRIPAFVVGALFFWMAGLFAI